MTITSQDLRDDRASIDVETTRHQPDKQSELYEVAASASSDTPEILPCWSCSCCRINLRRRPRRMYGEYHAHFKYDAGVESACPARGDGFYREPRRGLPDFPVLPE